MGGPKGPFWPKTGPNWEKSSGGQTWGQIWSQLPHIGLTGLESWLPHTLAWYGPLFLAPRGSKRARFAPTCLFCGSLMDSEGPRGPDLVPTAADWSAWLGIIVPHTLWPGIKPFLAPRSPKRARFGPKCPFWGSWRDSEDPREPDLVPTATGCCA